MDDTPVKICTYCGAEYSPEALKCAECGGKLVFSQEYEKYSVPLEDAEAIALVRQDTADYLKELSGFLAQNGIRSAIRFHGCPPGT
jgi:hypothetical protein